MESAASDDASDNANESSLVDDGFEFIANDTNNSMTLADNQYDPPESDEIIEAYTMDLAPMAQMARSIFRPVLHTYVDLYIRVRRKFYEQRLWQLMATGTITKGNMYSPQILPFWTVGFRLRLSSNYPMGKVMDAIKYRLGITNPGLRFCLDGFYGMINYTDIFGNTKDSCPWMEISHFSTVKSLKLQDGDSIFVSTVTMGQIEAVIAWRKKRSLDVKQPGDVEDVN